MTVLRYGFFGEDDAQRLFLQHYLAVISAGQNWRFEADEAFTSRFRGVNKKQVDDLFAEACQVGLSEYRQQCFFVGRDLDDHNPAAFQRKQAEMRQRLRSRCIQAVLLIPVQCVEHWLWYLQWRIDNPNSTKNINLETQPRPDAKEAVYRARKCTTKHSNPIVEQLAAGMDIAWLESHSTSFLSFHQQVKSYLAKQP